MARISQQAAYDISKKIVQKIQNQITSTEKEIEAIIRQIYEATIPAEISKAFKKHKDWMRSTSVVYVRGAGLSSNPRYTALQVKLPCDSTSTPYLQLSKAEAAEVQKLEQKKEKLQEKCNTTQKQIETTLLSLSTYKRALEAIPEILPYIPAQGGKNTGIMLVPQQLRETILCLSSADSKCVDKL
jgi:DNA repair exonuclease SbcCD ATPase subunit